MHKYELQAKYEILQIFRRDNKKDLHFCKSYGADTRIRTGDLILTKDALYLLSYISIFLLPHRATNIYYHIFEEKARGNLQFSIKNLLDAKNEIPRIAPEENYVTRSAGI